MWTHYADSYTGICVSYRARKMLEGLPNDAHLVRLGYGLRPPEIGKADTVNFAVAAHKILSHKKSCWAYEREWRVLASPRGPLPITSAGCIQDVLLGSRIDAAHKAHIQAALADLPIRIRAMQIDKYEHKWKTLKPLNHAVPLAAE
jgi:hypothetical protein